MKRHCEFIIKVHDSYQPDVSVIALDYFEDDDPGMILNHFITLATIGLDVSLHVDVFYTEEKETEE